MGVKANRQPEPTWWNGTGQYRVNTRCGNCGYETHLIIKAGHALKKLRCVTCGVTGEIKAAPEPK